MLVSSEREAPLDVHTDSGEDAVAVCFQGQELPTWVALLRVACSKYGTASVKGHQQLQRKKIAGRAGTGKQVSFWSTRTLLTVALLRVPCKQQLK